MNRAEEDYIKTIYELSINQDLKIIKNTDVSDRLGYTDQSVNEMIKKLAAKNFLEYIPYKGVQLTSKGHDEAVRLIRAHRVWEVFLSKYLNFSWEKVHDEAEMLEHAASKELIDKLYEFIGKPKYCGHGNPIPDSEGNIDNEFTKSLSDFKKGHIFTLKRVLDKKELLHYLSKINLRIGNRIEIIDIDNYSNLISVKNDKETLVITKKIANMLFGT